jgi:hypothetical protein
VRSGFERTAHAAHLTRQICSHPNIHSPAPNLHHNTLPVHIDENSTIANLSPFYKPIFHRIEMDGIDIPVQVLLIADRMLPKPPLPDRRFSPFLLG